MLLKELMVLVHTLVTKINSLEKELKETKQTLRNVVLTLVKKVKSLEATMKTKSKKVIVSESKSEEPEDQGRKIQDIDDDPLVSLVRESMKEKSTDFVTPTKALGEAQEEEISPTILEAAKTLSKVASQGVSKEKSTDKGKRYRRRARSVAKNINIGLDAEEEINTGIEEVSTGSTKVDSGTASERGQREGKAPMVKEDIQATHKTKEQTRQKEARLEEAIKLQAQLDEEVAKQIHLDKIVAQRMAEEEALSEQQKKRKAQLKKLKFEEIKEEFDKLVQQIDTFVPINLEATKAKLKRYGEELQIKTSKKQRFDDKDVLVIGEKVAEVKEEEQVKRTGKRKTQKARKGVNVDKSAQEDLESNKEESVEAMNPTPLTTKSDSVKYGTNRPEDAYDRVLWSDLRTMFDPPLNEDAIWSLPLQQKMVVHDKEFWRLFKTLSLDKSRLLGLNLLSDLEETFEEEDAETMAETIEKYMSNTRTNYGSGVVRLKIEDKDHFELKGQFLKELRENTFSSSNHKDANEHIEKVLEVVDLFHVPNITKVNEKVYAAQVGCERCKRPHYTKDCPLKEEGKTLKEAYYKQFGAPFQGGEYRAPALQEDLGAYLRDRVKSILNTIKADIHSIRCIRPSQYVGNYGLQFSEAYGASHINKTMSCKEKDPWSFTLPCYINNVYFDNSLAYLGASVSVMPLLTYLNLGLGKLAHIRLIVELADRTVKYPKGIAENVLVGIDKFVFPITLRVGDDKIIFKSVKPVSSIIKRVYMLSLRVRMELDLEARLMGETLLINRSLDPSYGDYIELNNLKEPLELRRNQVDDLMPTIMEVEVIDAPMDDLVEYMNDKLDTRIDDYPSDCDYDKKIYIDCAHNLKFSCMIGIEFVHVNIFPISYFNLISKKFYNSIMKDKLEYKENNVVEALMNVPIFVGTFSVIIYFSVLENMDAYRDEGMGDFIFGEPFLREVRNKAKRFEGTITLYKGNDSVTCQMVWSHPRFKNHTNRQCNKIPPLLQVSKQDKTDEISHSYQKLNGFYKGVLNLGPDFIQDLKMEEWLIRGHISVHEME
ncbi:hypothetical protein Tco_1145685 [Tanacetum coccineum]